MPWPITEEFLNEVNKQKYGGYNDWRLPTLDDPLTSDEKGVYFAYTPEEAALCLGISNKDEDAKKSDTALSRDQIFYPFRLVETETSGVTVNAKDLLEKRGTLCDDMDNDWSVVSSMFSAGG